MSDDIFVLCQHGLGQLPVVPFGLRRRSPRWLFRFARGYLFNPGVSLFLEAMQRALVESRYNLQHSLPLDHRFAADDYLTSPRMGHLQALS
ncbi:hypothetical protein D9M71_469810 [compost metagenome]